MTPVNLEPALQWSEPAPSNNSIRYDHVMAQTPFGRILITWKSWKEYRSYTVEENPGEEFAAYDYSSLQQAKEEAAKMYWARLREALGVGQDEVKAPEAQLPLALEPTTKELGEVTRTLFTPLALPAAGPVTSMTDRARMYPTSDPKYSILDNRLVNTATGKPIVAPIFLFHAQDRHLPAVLEFYLSLLVNHVHRHAVFERYRFVQHWQHTNFYLIKEPDTQIVG